MFKLMAALLVAGLLLPAEVLTKGIETRDMKPGYSLENEVSPFQAFNAVNSVFHDVTHFCVRNAEACETGKILASNAFYTVKGKLAQILAIDSQNNTSSDLDYTKTASIEK